MAGNFPLLALIPTDDPGWVEAAVAVTPVSTALTSANAIEEADVGADSWAILTAHKAYAQEVIDMTTAPEDLVTYAAEQLNTTVASMVNTAGCLYSFSADETAVQALETPEGLTVTERLMELDGGRRFRQNLTGSNNGFAAAGPALLPVGDGQAYAFFLRGDFRGVAGKTGVSRAGVMFQGASALQGHIFFQTFDDVELSTYVDSPAFSASQVNFVPPAVAGFRLYNEFIVVVTSAGIKVYSAEDQTLLNDYPTTIEDFYPVIYVEDNVAGYSGAQVDVAVSNIDESLFTGDFENFQHLCGLPGAGGGGEEEGPTFLPLEEVDQLFFDKGVETAEEVLIPQRPVSVLGGISALLNLSSAIARGIEADTRNSDTAFIDAWADRFTNDSTGAYSDASLSRFLCTMKKMNPSRAQFYLATIRAVFTAQGRDPMPEWIEEANFNNLCQYLPRSAAENLYDYIANVW